MGGKRNFDGSEKRIKSLPARMTQPVGKQVAQMIGVGVGIEQGKYKAEPITVNSISVSVGDDTGRTVWSKDSE